MEETTEQLRKLLRSADLSAEAKDGRDLREASTIDNSETHLHELASLLGSLNIDLATPEKKAKKDHKGPVESHEFSFSTTGGDSDESVISMAEELGGLPEEAIEDLDEMDLTVVRFNKNYALRGKSGRYLTANSTQDTANSAANTPRGALPRSIFQQNPITYTLGVNGQGIGEDLDCLNFVNLDSRDDTGPVRYGSLISIKAPAAKERLLGLRDGAKLGFWRNLVGQGEKWMILKGSSGRGTEEAGSRGKFVRIGDMVLVQTYRSDHLLSLYEGVSGNEAKLVYRDRAGLGAELWQVEQFGSLPIPYWLTNRPYLSGKYLTIPTVLKTPTQEIEARTFPGHTVVGGTMEGKSFLDFSHLGNPMDGRTDDLPKLDTMSVEYQQQLLVREILLVFAGFEGQYIRLAASSTTASGLPTSVHGIHGEKGHGYASETGFSMYDDVMQGTATNSYYNSLYGNNPKGPAIIPKLAQVKFLIDIDSADKSTASQILQLIPLCEGATHIREFLRQHLRYEYGLVSHALCSGIKKIMREFDILIAQLEHLHSQNKLTLQKMVFLLQPSIVTILILEKLCLRLHNCIGGKMLDIVHMCMLEQGDAKSRELHCHLLQIASEPFLNMLSSWLFSGDLDDSYHEFMIKEDATVSREALEEDFNAQYWDSRYTLREEHVPRILKRYATKALIAGKYLNVIRECKSGGLSTRYERRSLSHSSTRGAITADNIALPTKKKLTLDKDVTDTNLALAIDEAYQFSSQALLQLLEQGHGLSSQLQSLRRFFLLEHGDFFTQFMDTAETELRKDVKDISLVRVEGLLQLAVQTSTLGTDNNKENLTCTLASHNLIQHLHLIQSAGESSNTEAYTSLTSQGLKGVEALTLDYRVGWPLSIVLSRRAITKYQLLSRLLYFSKHVERRVLSCWMDHQRTKQLNVRHGLGPSYCLRHRMLQFLQNFVYYMTLEVIGPRGHEMQTELESATDMDQVLEIHEKFLDACLKECLLASQDLLKILTKIMTTCLLFADQMNKFNVEIDTKDLVISTITNKTRTLSVKTKSSTRFDVTNNSNYIDDGKMKLIRERREQINSARSSFIEKETSHESFIRMFVKFSDTFDEQLKEFLDKLWTDSYKHHAQLSNLCVRLDYNGFYSNEYA